MKDTVHSSIAWLVNIEFWIVGILVAASFVSARFLLPTVIAAVLFWILRFLTAKRLTIRTPADGSIIILVVLIPVTLWATALPDITRPQVYRLLAGIALYYAVVNWATTRPRLQVLGLGIIGAGVGLCAISLVSVNWPIEKFFAFLNPIYHHFYVFVSDSVNPNVMAGSLVILLPLPLAWLFFGWKEISGLLRMSFVIAVTFMVLILGLTLSRGAWIACGVMVMTLAILRWRRSWIFILAAVLVFAAGLLWLGPTSIMNALLQNNSLGGMDGRAEVWSRALFMIRDFSITGVGMGSFSPVAEAMYPFSVVIPGRIPHAHNLFFQIAVDLGIPGLIAWFSIFLIITLIAWKTYQIGRQRNNLLFVVVGAGLLGSQAALAAHGLTDAVTWGMVRSAPLVWALWGTAAAGWQLCSSERNLGNQPSPS